MYFRYCHARVVCTHELVTAWESKYQPATRGRHSNEQVRSRNECHTVQYVILKEEKKIGKEAQGIKAKAMGP